LLATMSRGRGQRSRLKSQNACSRKSKTCR
jgi:hypothetical protein